MRIAITTPTGHIGRRVVENLQDWGGHELVLLARKPEKLENERARGAEVILGNLEDEDYVKRATRGADVLFWVIPPKLNEEHYRAFQDRLAEIAANAVRENGIERVVLLSSIGAQFGSGVGPVNGLHDAEEVLRRAAPNLTILRPGYFMENFLTSLETIAEQHSIFLPVCGNAKVPIVATRDIADAAAKILVDTEGSGVRIVPLYGPRDYTFAEAAKIIGDAIGEHVEHIRVSRKQIHDALISLGASEDVAELFPELYEAIDSGRLKPDPPRTPESTTQTTFEEFAGSVIAPAIRS